MTKANPVVTDTKLADLLPCPFCGGEAYLYRHRSIPGLPTVSIEAAHTEECPLAQAMAYVPMHHTEAEAITAWNTRPATDTAVEPEPYRCSTCKIRLPGGYSACDETMGQYCPVCWPAVDCEERHGEGCATQVWDDAHPRQVAVRNALVSLLEHEGDGWAALAASEEIILTTFARHPTADEGDALLEGALDQLIEIHDYSGGADTAMSDDYVVARTQDMIAKLTAHLKGPDHADH
jgi:hypothetical protein